MGVSQVVSALIDIYLKRYNGYEKIKSTVSYLGIFQSYKGYIGHLEIPGFALAACAAEYSSSLQGNNDGPGVDGNNTAYDVSGLYLCF